MEEFTDHTLWDAARFYADLGWRVVPLHTPNSQGQCSCGDPACDHVGKHPRIRNWQKRASNNQTDIDKWWNQWPDANVGIATYGMIVVDQDRGELPGDLPECPTVQTAKGYHYYLRKPEGIEITNRVDVDRLGFDIRTDNGLVVAPPSKHASGILYDWLYPTGPTLPDPPKWLLDLITKSAEPIQPEPLPNPTQGGAGGYVEVAVQRECTKVRNAPSGQRNDQLNKRAFALGTLVGGGELDEESTAEKLFEAALEAGMSRGEAKDTIRSGMKAGIQRPRSVPPATAPKDTNSQTNSLEVKRWALQDEYINKSPTWQPHAKILECLHQEEYGDAQLLAAMYADRLVYDHAERQWYVWGKHHWHADQCGLIRHLISGQVARQYLHLAAELKPQAVSDDNSAKIIEQLLTRARHLRKLNRCNNVQQYATSMLGITGEEWDRNPWVLGVANGVVDLKTGKLRDGRALDYIRIASETVWKGIDAPAARFEQFINEIFDNNTEIVAFMRRLLGYGITGLTVEHIFPVLYGEKGRNGKDTLLECLKGTLGNVADPVSTDVLLAPVGRGSAQPHLMDLMGKRLVWASETSAGSRLNEAQVKLITGGGTIKTRPLYGSMVEFRPTHLVLLITNFKPKASAEDEALWTRMVLVPFELRFVANPQAPDERESDPHLLDKLEKERSGILAWLVRGCLEWQKQKGLQVPDSIKASTQSYREEEDVIGQFLLDECEPSDARVTGNDIYHAYRQWAENNGMTPLNLMNFGKRLKKRLKHKRTNSGIEYLGVRIKGVGVYSSVGFSEESLHEENQPENSSEKPTQVYTPTPNGNTPPLGRVRKGNR
ncbi:MAG: hypothetical protein EOM24_00900 [Chloroflexia bacterium]|nr:hypothetical protein [Chloroflexia bacterium]